MSTAISHQDAAPQPFRIAINASHAKTGGGVTYLRQMLPLFAAEPGVSVYLILHRAQLPLFDPIPDGIEIVACDYTPRFFPTLIW